jgi:organic hydroperoxide reductase OsmC/OhrA
MKESIAAPFEVNLRWQATQDESLASSEQSISNSFSRDHTIHFGSGQCIKASSAVEFSGSALCVNPEESLLAALSSCHMLTFLKIAHAKRLPVINYHDQAFAVLGRNALQRTAITQIILNPDITFANSIYVSDSVLAKMHQLAHDNCFIANTLLCDVRINRKRQEE